LAEAEVEAENFWEGIYEDLRAITSVGTATTAITIA